MKACYLLFPVGSTKITRSYRIPAMVTQGEILLIVSTSNDHGVQWLKYSQ